MEPAANSHFSGLLTFGTLGVLFLLATLFWIWMLADCLKRETDRGDVRLWWALGIGITHAFGATLYLFLRKLPRKTQLKQSPSKP